LATVRVVMGLSYRAWGGIHAASLHWARGVVALAVLLISRLPESSPYFGAR
jgi:hypothetical protein